MKREQSKFKSLTVLLVALFLTAGFTTPATAQKTIELSDEQVENIVRLSYPYVALYNVNNKFALDESAAAYSGGYNKIIRQMTLFDHTMRSIARPNNDTLYLSAMIDVRQEPMILEFPSFDSKYVSLMVTAYDHYVNIPMSTTKGDFDKPARALFYSQRTQGYRGDAVPGVDHVMELTGDFVSAVLRIMPHANEPARLQRNLTAMRETRLLTLSDYLDQNAAEVEFVPWQTPPGVERELDVRLHEAEFPPFGRTDFDVFEDNLLEVMQFVFNHTTFDPKDDNDQALLAAYKSLGVEPGKVYDPKTAAQIDGQQFRVVAQAVAREALAKLADPSFHEQLTQIFLPKGEMDQELLVDLSIIGPIGVPAREALYPPITTADGKPMNAMHDYVIRMDAELLPPANAFWSLTLYDLENGFFIPNDSKKYSVGENAGMKLNAQGGIEIHVAARKPDGVPHENWLPINRDDYGVDLIMRIYAPDLERFKTWTPPKAELVHGPEPKVLEGKWTRPVLQPVIVNVDNFVRAETAAQIDRFQPLVGGKINTWGHLRIPVPLDAQSVIRMNRDTLYSAALIDISKGATLTIPETGDRYLMINVINEDHYINKVYHDAGSYELTIEEFHTPYVFLNARILVNASDPADIKKANALQDQITTKAASARPYTHPNYDQVSYKATYKPLIELSRGVSGTKRMFGKKEEVDEVRHLLGTAFGFGGLPESEAYYLNIEPNLPVGAYQLTVKDVPVNAFWSISVYNKDGYFQKNKHDAYSMNNISGTPNEDGSFTIHFGGDPKSVNYLHIREGWNYTVRLYQPRKEILDGTWVFPSVKKVK